MPSSDLHFTNLILSVLHQYIALREHERVLVEARDKEIKDLQNHVKGLEKQKHEMDAHQKVQDQVIDAQQELIESLEREAGSAGPPSPMLCSLMPPPPPPPPAPVSRPQTPYPFIYSPSDSALSDFIGASSSSGDDGALASKRQEERAENGESSKRQRTEV
ncbi:hypothetical protein HJFPF1_08379 [Paramyrothecium foliicola]|nr:hypothetical protein HJFPF1_08379 [Paramyrothecium foliicola]